MLRVGEQVRHALSETLQRGEIIDPVIETAVISVTEVRMSPDLKIATAFVSPLGSPDAGAVVEALNRHAKFLRGILGRMIDMKFTPDLRFVHDESFNEAARIDALFMRPDIARDLHHDDDADEDQD